MIASTMATWHDLLALMEHYQERCWSEPIQLRTMRGWVRELVRLAGDSEELRRYALSGFARRLVTNYYTLPEQIEMLDLIAELTPVRLDKTTYRHDLILGIYGKGTYWLDRKSRYYYGDPRLLRPLIGAVLVALDGHRIPLPDEYAQLGVWYEELAPGGPLYPTEEHLDYVRRFEQFSENIIWDNRDQDFITITNFPAPPNKPSPEHWSETQHLI